MGRSDQNKDDRRVLGLFEPGRRKYIPPQGREFRLTDVHGKIAHKILA